MGSSNKQDEPVDHTEAAREIAQMISDFRHEVWAKISGEINAEVKEVEASDFDPARGRGRGPWWADGGEP
jgi:hypothetical protein